MMVTQKIESLEWKYQAEGNANIIIKNEENNMVLRIRKYAKEQETSHSKKIGSLISLDQEQIYLKQISATYFKNQKQYLSLHTPVFLSKNFLVELLDKINLKRPEFRKTKSISLESQTCILMPFIGKFKPERPIESNVSISVEIKPKWGFIPTSKFIKNTAKKEICRFCLHQNYKFKLCNKSPSNYCPIDLFGGFKSSVDHAIKSLIETPQNNLKLAVNGTVCSADDLASQSDFNRENLPRILTEIFYRDSEPSIPGEKIQLQKCKQSHFAKVLSDGVKFGPKGVLNLLRELQSLDRFDIEYIFPHYKKIVLQSGFEEKHFLDYQSDLWKDFFRLGQEPSSESKDIEIWDICRYLIAATFKDCSVLITFCQVNPHIDDTDQPNNVVDVDGKCFQYEIKLIDLDPRLLQNIAFYHQQDTDIVSAWGI